MDYSNLVFFNGDMFISNIYNSRNYRRDGLKVELIFCLRISKLTFA